MIMSIHHESNTQMRESQSSKTGTLSSAYPVLDQIKDQAWLNAISRAKAMQTPAQTVMFSGNEPCNNFILILEGTVRIYQTAADGREMTLYRVNAGDICVLSLNSMLQNQSFNAVAETDTPVSCLVMSDKDFHSAMNGSETFRNFVITTLTERLCEAMHLIQNTAFNHLNMRLACMLGSLFERNQGDVLYITHQELAHELGTTREVVSRILKEFEKNECVKLSRGKIELASAEGLEWFSEAE